MSGGLWLPVVGVGLAAAAAAAAAGTLCPTGTGGAGAAMGAVCTACSRVGLFLRGSSWGLVRPKGQDRIVFMMQEPCLLRLCYVSTDGG